MSAKIKALFSKAPSELQSPEQSQPTDIAPRVGGTASPAETLAEVETNAAEKEKEGANIEKQPTSGTTNNQEAGLPTGLKMQLICLSLLLVNFLVALDQTIVAAAVPVIANDFHALSDVGWNVPIGGVSLAIAFLFLNPHEPVQPLSVRERLVRMDWIGTTFLLGSIISLLLALQVRQNVGLPFLLLMNVPLHQDGGLVHPWNSPREKGLIIAFALLFILFFITQWVMKENASINLRVLRHRSIFLAALVNLTVGSVYFALLYYVPIYFQAVRGSTPIHSGVQALALIGSAIVTVIVSGGLVEAFKGRFNPEMYSSFGFLCSLGIEWATIKEGDAVNLAGGA
ncbi:hypothetical protein P7C70_g6862, partial [Phenoliferia sp. Uapishka_3]